MLDGIQPLADDILANLIKIHYPNWYNKLISVQYPKKVHVYTVLAEKTDNLIVTIYYI